MPFSTLYTPIYNVQSKDKNIVWIWDFCYKNGEGINLCLSMQNMWFPRFMFVTMNCLFNRFIAIVMKYYVSIMLEVFSYRCFPLIVPRFWFVTRICFSWTAVHYCCLYLTSLTNRCFIKYFSMYCTCIVLLTWSNVHYTIFPDNSTTVSLFNEDCKKNIKRTSPFPVKSEFRCQRSLKFSDQFRHNDELV